MLITRNPSAHVFVISWSQQWSAVDVSEVICGHGTAGDGYQCLSTIGWPWVSRAGWLMSQVRVVFLPGHIRFPFRCFMSVLASPPSRWVSPRVFLVFIHPSSVRRIHRERWSQREPWSQILKHKHSENRRGPLQMSTSLHNSLEPLLKIYSRPPSPCSSSTHPSLSCNRSRRAALSQMKQSLINLRPSLTCTIRFNAHN